MPSPHHWSATAKLAIAAVIALLLSFGLCAAGGGFDTHVSTFQIALTYLGAGLFFLAILLLIVASAKRERHRKQTSPRPKK